MYNEQEMAPPVAEKRGPEKFVQWKDTEKLTKTTGPTSSCPSSSGVRKTRLSTRQQSTNSCVSATPEEVEEIKKRYKRGRRGDLNVTNEGTTTQTIPEETVADPGPQFRAPRQVLSVSTPNNPVVLPEAVHTITNPGSSRGKINVSNKSVGKRVEDRDTVVPSAEEGLRSPECRRLDRGK